MAPIMKFQTQRHGKYLKKRQYKRAKITPLTIPQSIAMKRIAHNAVTSAAETKVGYFSVSTAPKEQTITSYNIFYQAGMTQGTGAENSTMIGDKLNCVGFRLRLNLIQEVNQATCFYTIALVATDKYATTTSLGAADLFPSYGLVGFPIRFDSSKCKVIGRIDGKLKGAISGVNDGDAHDRYIPFSKFLQFRDLATNYELREQNYYLVLYASRGGTLGVTNAVGVYGQVEVYYKDV